ncbi:acetamidase [Phlyctema vagabunda]|uniref:amidase n=1 Tax=Phlyctema vagabunda TaxID=108571 RepID=A0ABR4PX33_9HELO
MADVVAKDEHQIPSSSEFAPISPAWQDAARQRREDINGAIPSEYIIPDFLLKGHHFLDLPVRCGILDQRELEITSMTATSLLKGIHEEKYSAVEVTTAFCKRAAIAHQATNCLALVLFEQALKDAEALDEYMRVNHRPIGPLHGLPISVKEHVDLRNTPSTSGFIAWANVVSSTDSLIVKVLREAGAVFHVKTTNPQSLMALETDSNLYGRTKNPHNTKLTPGGSSGGEGALIAMRGSLLGIGTDIGGSIRAPAGFSGIYGLKPSISRLPHSGLAGVHGGMENIVGAVGPMAVSPEDLRLFCSVALDAQPWLYEPSLIEIPWRPTITIPTKMRIGVLSNDGVVSPHPPVARCLRETADALGRAGHTIIPWRSSLHPDIIATINEAYFLDGAEEYYEVMKQGNEPPVPIIKMLLDKTHPKHCTARETWKINQRRNALQTIYAAELNAAELDFILCPVNASVASAHGESTYWGYTSAFNLLDYTGAVLPISTVQETDTWENFPGTYLSEQDRAFGAFYTGPEKYKNAPISLQIVTRRFGEEKALLIMEEIERVLGLRDSKL